MDKFVQATLRTIGPGGLKCPCCTDYRTFGNHAKQKPNLSKLRRTRLKQQDRTDYDKYIRQEMEKMDQWEAEWEDEWDYDHKAMKAVNNGE